MSSSRATSSYLLITLAMTWPLLPGLARDVPGDLGDSLLNMWILGWGAENVPRVLTGRMSLTDFWNANIFHPEPLTLYYRSFVEAGVVFDREVEFGRATSTNFDVDSGFITRAGFRY